MKKKYLTVTENQNYELLVDVSFKNSVIISTSKIIEI